MLQDPILSSNSSILVLAKFFSQQLHVALVNALVNILARTLRLPKREAVLHAPSIKQRCRNRCIDSPCRRALYHAPTSSGAQVATSSTGHVCKYGRGLV